MKILEKITLWIFSIIILIISIIMCLLIFRWVDINTFSMIISSGIHNQPYSNVILIVSILFIILTIKCIFFSSSIIKDSIGKDGILLENDSGKLLISKDTIENLVNNVTKGFDSIENVTTKVIFDKESNLKVYVNLFVHSNTVIKDLSANLQMKIKEAVKKAIDLEIKEVNIKIRNITPAKEQNIIKE